MSDLDREWWLERLTNVHDPAKCGGRPCVLHNPTDHHMATFPIHWRSDRRIFERICPHNVGHPDPDQFVFWRETGQEWQAVHGCCGECCTPPDVSRETVAPLP